MSGSMRALPEQEQRGVLIRSCKKSGRPDTRRPDKYCVPSMALILLVKVQSRVFTAKCSEPQDGVSNGMGEGSDVAKFLSLRTET